MLSETPVVGSKCDFIKQGYRKFPAARHLVFYRCVNQSEIEIVRILHKRMDAEAQVRNP